MNFSPPREKTKKSILIVDDEPTNIGVFMDLLKDDYHLRAARNGAQALERMQTPPLPDIILLDVMMPEMNGYEVCRRLKTNPATHHIPVIFVSALKNEGDEARGLSVGAVDYITKPISPPIVEARIRNHLMLKEAREALQNQNDALEKLVAERTRELQMTRDATILCMTSLAETRDDDTGNHIRRTQHFLRELALALRANPDYAPHLDDRAIDMLYKSAPLHDIGKVGIPDHILLKPEKLTDEEFEAMKRHTVLGRNAIANAEKILTEEGGADDGTTFLRMAREIASSHHEHWNGAGYPDGLKGTEIPLAARLMAVADVYDALISKRAYKPPYSYVKAKEMIIEARGEQFDPAIVDAFVACADRLEEIAEHYSVGE